MTDAKIARISFFDATTTTRETTTANSSLNAMDHTRNNGTLNAICISKEHEYSYCKILHKGKADFTKSPTIWQGNICG